MPANACASCSAIFPHWSPTMTDHPPPGREKRVDLHALEAGADDARTNAVVAAALVAVATATIVAAPRRPTEPPTTDVIASWAESRHVPTNGELLATYR